MAESEQAPEQRPSKRVKNAPPDRGPNLQADALFKYSLQLPQRFTPGSIQANRIALRVEGSSCVAYVANAQNIYEVSLGAELAAADSGVCLDMGKEGVLVPRRAEVGNVRQLEQMSYMAAEVQSLYAGIHEGYHLLAASDAVGNVRLMAAPLADADGAAGEGTSPALQVLDLSAPFRGECGWTGIAVRSLGVAAAGGAPPDDAGGPTIGGGGGGPSLDVAVARQRLRDVNIYRDGSVLRSLHMLQGPTALSYLPPGPFGGCADAAVGLLAVAEEHQVSLWDVRQGERGGCVQRVGLSGGGFPLYCLSWLAAAPRAKQHGGGEGMLAVTGCERSVVVLEPRKWHIAAKWPGCVKYPATHLAPSLVAPGYIYVAGLDYEVAAGRWDGSCGSSAGNANSASGGHGRAMGPAQLRTGREKEEQAAGAATAEDERPEGGASRGGLTFRGDSKWLGLAATCLPSLGRPNDRQGSCRREVVAALSLSGNLYVLVALATTPVAHADA